MREEEREGEGRKEERGWDEERGRDRSKIGNNFGSNCVGISTN